MTLRLKTHKLATGIRTVSYMNSTALMVTAFPLQTDQESGWVAWHAPSYELGTTQPAYARYRDDGNEAQSGDGRLVWDWVFDTFTNDMLAYWKTTFPDNGPVTVLAYNEYDVAVYLTAILKHPRPPRPNQSGDMEWAPGGWDNVRWRFRRGVVILP